MSADGIDLEGERRARIEKALARISELDPTWARMFDSYVLSGMYERNVIDQKTRELCAVAALCVLDRRNPLRDHLKGAIRNGATEAEVVEVLVQTSVYGGFPVALSGLEAWREVKGELGL